jgi:hypothetical protein
MKKFNSNTFFKHLVLVFSIAYLLGSFTNMLYIPRYAPLYSKTVYAAGFDFNPIVKCAKFHSINFLQIIDRSTFDTDQSDTYRCVPKSFELIFIGLGFPELKARSIPPQFNIFYNLQHCYLSFCTFRI